VHLSEIEGMPQQEVADRLELSLSGEVPHPERAGHAQGHPGAMLPLRVRPRGNVMGYDPKPDRNVCRNCDELDTPKP